ncbi:MAG: hypothetical protein M0D57_03035 [Sphingobacteriales bacterium JAD_PAG50586_3]|nr:MAG: hypothetical protein M0D57_03035 [Sphingobacteriales bacterium JAD_PAG50586_3]
MEMSMSYGRGGSGNATTIFLLHYLTWYAAVVAFIIMSFRRHKEIKQSKSVFDFGMYSKYSGDFHPAF